MSALIDDLLKQQADIEQKIKEARKTALNEAIVSARSIIERHGLTVADLFSAGKAKTKAPSKVAAKYRDTVTGATWSGRGIAPKWLAGKNKTDYLIA